MRVDLLIKDQARTLMAELSNNTDEVLTLNKGIEHNEDWAYKHLFKECFPKIAAWQPLRGEHQELTKDLFQDALLKYRGKLAQGNIENPCAWLFTVVKNDFYRHQQKNKPMITLDENKEECMDFDEQGSFSPEDWASAYDCILALGKAEQKLLFMSFFHKFPDEQIAGSLGYLNLNTMRAARSRAMGKLRNCLKNSQG